MRGSEGVGEGKREGERAEEKEYERERREGTKWKLRE